MTQSRGERLLEEVLSKAPEKRPSDIDKRYSFKEYLDLFLEKPYIEDSAHQRIYRMIMEYGTETYERELQGEGAAEKITDYKIFTEGKTPFGKEGALYGIDESLDKTVKEIGNGANALGGQKRIQILLGPVGSGKTTEGYVLKKAYEDFSRKDKGALYTFVWDTSKEEEHYEEDEVMCPIQESPLKLITDEEERKKIIKEGQENLLNSLKKVHEKWDPEGERMIYTLEVQGPLCPECRQFYKMKYDRYLEEVSENPEEPSSQEIKEAEKRVLDDVTVKRLIISEQEKRGIATLKPADEKDQDRTELTGDTAMNLVAKYGQSDARAFDYKLGTLLAANRGIADIEEMYKLKDQFLFDFLEASAHGVIDPKGFPEISVDTFILGRSNLAEYRKKRKTGEMKAFNDRNKIINVPYALNYEIDEKIGRKFASPALEAGIHFMPHSFEALSQWATLTRVTTPHHDISKMDKVDAYAGKRIEKTAFDLRKEMEESKGKLEDEVDEGMAGASPRLIRDVIGSAVMNDEEGCVNVWDLLNQLEETIPAHMSIPEKNVEEYTDYIEDVKQKLDNELIEDVRKAMSYDPEELKNLEQKYRNHVRAYNEDEKIIDEVTGEEKPPDEKFMREIERQKPLGISDSRKDGFRKEIDSFLARQVMKEERKENPLLESDKYRRVLENYLWEQKKRNINWESIVSDIERKASPEARERTSSWIENLKDQGYCNHCAKNVFERVGVKIAKEELEKK